MNEPYASNESNSDSETDLLWKFLVVRAYVLYQRSFWKFFVIALPPAILAVLFNFIWSFVLRQLVVRGWLNFQTQFFSLPFIYGSGFIRGMGYWLISTLFFAAVATVVLYGGTSISQVSDAYTIVRRRLGAIVISGLITGAGYLLAVDVCGFALLKLVQKLPFRLPWIVDNVVFSLPILMVAALIFRAGLAIPELIENPETSPFQAIRNSLLKTENWEPFFILFLIKSALIGYGLYVLAGLALQQLLQHQILNQAAYEWGRYLFFIYLAAMLQTPLFIVLSVLYRNLAFKQDSAVGAQ